MSQIGGRFLAERVLGDEVTFNLRYKTSNERSKRIQRGLALRFSAWRIQNHETSRAPTTAV